MFALTFFVGRALQPYIQLPGSSSLEPADVSPAPTKEPPPPLTPPPPPPKPAAVQPSSAPAPKVAESVAASAERATLAAERALPTGASHPAQTAGNKTASPIAPQQQQQQLQQAKVAPVSKIPTSAKVSPPQARPAEQTVGAATASQTQAKPQGSSSSLPQPLSKMSAEWCEEQVKTYQFTFEEADKDKSGNLSFDEVKDVMEKSGFRGGVEDLKRIFSHLDINQDQKISKYEFMAAMKKVPRVNMKEFALRRAFRTLDKDGSGFLNREEIIDATKKYANMDISAEKISDLLLYLIREDQDQKVNYEEFVQVFGYRATGNHLMELFKKIDTDNSGKLSREELVKSIKADSELSLKADRISEMLVRWCKGDNQIDYEQFVKVYTEQKAEL